MEHTIDSFQTKTTKNTTVVNQVGCEEWESGK
jgi:hypothetical protein